MKISIDISQIVYEGTGVARFTKGLVNSIIEFDKNNQWTFLFSSLRRKLDFELEKKISKKGYELIKWKIPPTALSFLWNDLHKLKFLNNKLLNSTDWFITSDWTEPTLSCKKATIIHDLVYIRYPETVDKKILETQRKRLFWVKKESKIIFADSETTKKDLSDLFKINSSKIVVNYPGVDIIEPEKTQIEKTLTKFELSKPFILTVGKLEPRKNLERLIDAYEQANEPKPDLVIVGPKGWQKFNNLTIKRLNGIKILGYVSDLELHSLYSSCLFFIYPSIWEGFGYPVVEAMKLQVPVATSNTSSLKEITGDAVMLFNPFDTKDITRCIDRLINDELLRKELVIKSSKRREMFTWNNYYNKMINAFINYN